MDSKKQSRLAGPLSKKKKFSKTEDQRLIELTREFGTKNWKDISRRMSPRTPRQCRDRWENYLSPELNTNDWTLEEDNTLLEKQMIYGNKWKIIRIFLPGRSKNSIKYRYQLLKMRRNFNNEPTASFHPMTIENMNVVNPVMAPMPVSNFNYLNAMVPVNNIIYSPYVPPQQLCGVYFVVLQMNNQ
ncbi:Myb-like DNA-binding domain containing protein [Tritrichomonas foetus]|uniref:Myb-like DNA-binding domain containing protein n=1 Tax=Tritrichomonas foetus TaxID=1144522 RepID=A0A1J4KA14_9EUKA|nr:Myb-like DNA-binding domain containing protein [Tritrichomonas foetus]|eukprot:OHT07794.1 Myb-like DNA-binding domain containing protein [Tritrichomonas foetus]